MIQISYKIGVVKGEDINAGDGAVRKDIQVITQQRWIFLYFDP